MAAGEGNLSRIHWHDPSSRQEGPGQPHHLGEEVGTWAGKVPSSVLAELTRVYAVRAAFVSVVSACSNESLCTTTRARKKKKNLTHDSDW